MAKKNRSHTSAVHRYPKGGQINPSAETNNSANKSTATPAQTATDKKYAYVVNGIGTKPIQVNLGANDCTGEELLKHANIKVGKDQTVTLGKKPVHDLKSLRIKPGDTLVLSARLNNG